MFPRTSLARAEEAPALAPAEDVKSPAPNAALMLSCMTRTTPTHVTVSYSGKERRQSKTNKSQKRAPTVMTNGNDQRSSSTVMTNGYDLRIRPMMTNGKDQRL